MHYICLKGNYEYKNEFRTAIFQFPHSHMYWHILQKGILIVFNTKKPVNILGLFIVSHCSFASFVIVAASINPKLPMLRCSSIYSLIIERWK